MKEWIKTDKLNEVIKSIASLTAVDVLVGIPEDTTEREDDAPNNAYLGYLHEHGWPASNIPERPFLVPGVADGKQKYQSRLLKAANFALDGQKGKALEQMAAAGDIAAMSAKNKINTGDFEPLKPSTIANRYRQRKTKSRRESEKEYLKLVSSGVEAPDAQAATGIQPLINTTELRDSITYVIREKD